jgi:hypothetical protein
MKTLCKIVKAGIKFYGRNLKKFTQLIVIPEGVCYAQ